MRKRILNIILAWSALGVFFVSCYDDKGNYDYVALQEVVIDTVGCGIQSAYSLARYDRLILEPKVRFNGKEVSNSDNAPLDYLWMIYTRGTSAGSSYVSDTIGKALVLDSEITPLAGAYTIQLTVTNREDGVKQYLKISCQVEESITAGWMLLYEKADMPGTSDVGLVVNPLVKKNIIKDREYWNLYSASNGAPLEGNPIRIYNPLTNANMSLPSDVVCLTDKQIVKVNNATFETIGTFGDMFYKAPSRASVTWYGTSGMMSRRNILINDNKLHTVSYMMVAGGGNYFGDPKTSALEYGELASWGSDISNIYEAVVYDQTNTRFYRIVQYASPSQLTPFEVQSPSAKFDVNNTGMTLLMGDWGRSGTAADYATAYDYLIMQKENERYLAVANFCGQDATNTNIGVGLYDITHSPDILNATSMTAAYAGEYVLYGAGNKVYNLEYNSSTIAKEAWTVPSADENEKVTCVRIQKFYFGSLFRMIMPNPNTIVHIATWNEKTNEGKLYQCSIGIADGKIGEAQKVYKVPGKVKDMAWKYVFEM